MHYCIGRVTAFNCEEYIIGICPLSNCTNRFVMKWMINTAFTVKFLDEIIAKLSDFHPRFHERDVHCRTFSLWQSWRV
jgi:hypothetical protein